MQIGDDAFKNVLAYLAQEQFENIAILVDMWLGGVSIPMNDKNTIKNKPWRGALHHYFAPSELLKCKLFYNLSSTTSVGKIDFIS